MKAEDKATARHTHGKGRDALETFFTCLCKMQTDFSSMCVFFSPSSVGLNAIIKANEPQLLDSLITWNADR